METHSSLPQFIWNNLSASALNAVASEAFKNQVANYVKKTSQIKLSSIKMYSLSLSWWWYLNEEILLTLRIQIQIQIQKSMVCNKFEAL